MRQPAGTARRVFSLNLFRGQQTHHCWGFELRNADERSYSVRVALCAARSIARASLRPLIQRATNKQTKGGTSYAYDHDIHAL
jgi:hypothetical protein